MNFKKYFVGLLALASLAACQKADPYMELSQKKFAVEAEGGVITADISANVYYRINNDMDWTTVEIAETQGETTTLKLTVAPNDKFESRKGRVRFIGDNVTPLYIEVEQAAKVPVGVSINEINVGFTDTNAKFTILGNKPWTVTCDNPAFVLSKTSGNGEDDITVTFPENEKTTEVVAVVTVDINGEKYTVTITQAAAPSKERIDLSANGTSNCYLVSAPGYYKFKATKAGNGIIPLSLSTMSADIAPASVAVLWCTTNTKVAPADNSSLISKVSLENDYVVFNTTDMAKLVEGNVVIAAFDASNNIIWSWHIWMTEESTDIAVGAVQWMDRNLGALSPSSYKTTDPLACGLQYQWGRKDPFRGAWTFDQEELNMQAGATGTWPAPEVVTELNGSIAFTIANPQQVLYVTDSKYNNKDWIWNDLHDDIWGGGTDKALHAKTMFDPCPVGYHIPSSGMHTDVAATLGISKTDIDTACYGIGKEGFWLVYPGGLLYNTGELGGPVGEYSWYASSSTSGVNMLCTRSHTTACNFGGATSARTCGYSVRCVKE